MKLTNNKYCIVGIGNHAVSKLIPSILKSGKKIVGIVSRTNKTNLRKYKRFKYVDQAVRKLPRDTMYLLSTPPDTHFGLIKKLIKQNLNIIVEKPIFTHPNQVIAFKKTYFNKKVILKEIFMYRHSLMFKKSISFIKEEYQHINKIECNFVIPSNPENSFRDETKIESSCLYDIGSYVFDYFTTFNLNLHSFEIINTNYVDDKLHNMHFSFKLGSINVYSQIGIDKTYKNNLIINKKDGKQINFNTFFYGRTCNKEINIINNKKERKNIVFYEKDAFTLMFKKNDKFKNLYKNKEYYKLKKINQIFLEFRNKLKK